MAERRTRPGRWRAIVAVVALYALALQGFLAGLHPAAPGLDALCAPDRAHGSGGGHGPGGDGERHDPCCLAPGRCALAGPAAVPVATAFARPDFSAVPVRYARTGIGARPTSLQRPFGARGPPTA